MENPETLAEGRVVKAQILEEETIKVGSRVSNETLTGSQLLSEVPLDRVEGNGIRVSVAASGEVVPVELDKKEKDGTLGGHALGDGGSRMAAASSELQENGKKIVKGNVTVAVDGSAVNDKDSGGAQTLPETVLKKEGSSCFNGGDSATKIKVSGDGSPKQKGGLLSDNGEGNPDDEVSGISVHMVETKKSNSVVGKEEKEEVDEGEEEEEVANDEDHEFSIGDFVWGKIKSHPWWPGQIYDSSDASKYAAQFHRRNRLLVAYFGDGTFAWCYPSQLKPFKENFELMSNQSNSKSFLNAVEAAVDEIGRRVELEMTCTCVPEELRNRIARPLSVNAGIREGVVVPGGGIGELTITLYKPAELLALLRDFAEVVSVNSIMELMVLRSCLSAFFRAKGYAQLPMYYEAEDVTGPEDFAVNNEMDKTIVDDLTGESILHPAKADQLSSPVGHGVSKPCQTSSLRWPGISDDKLHQRKKQKSMAELLAGDVDLECRNGESDAAGEIFSGKPVSASKKERKDSEYDISIGAEDSAGDYSGLQTKKLNKSKLLVSPPTADKKSSSINNDDRGAESAAVSSSPRVRKKSKYLSPPYTDLIWGNKILNSSKDSETVSPKAKMVSSTGDFTSRDEDQLTETPPIVKCSSQTSQKKSSKESGVRHNASSYSSPRTPNSVNYKNIFMEDDAFTDEMFSDFLTIALDPFYLEGSQRFDTFKGFFSRFRSSVYWNESNSMTDSDQLVVQSGRVMKSLESNPGSSGQASQAIDQGGRKRKSLEGNPDSFVPASQAADQGIRRKKSSESKTGSSGRASQAAGQGVRRKKSSESKAGSSGRASQAGDQIGRKRKSLENNPGSSVRASLATDQSGTKSKLLESNPGSSLQASLATDQSGTKSKSLASNPGSSGQASQAADQSGTKSKSLESNPDSSGRASQEADQIDTKSKSLQQSNPDSSRQASEAADQSGTKSKSLESNPDSSRQASEAADQSGAKRKSLESNPDSSGRASQAADQSGKKRKSLGVSPGSSGRASQATDQSGKQAPRPSDQSGRKRKSLEGNPDSTGRASQATGQRGRKRKSLEGNPGSSGRASNASDHPSPGPKSKRKKKATEEAFLLNAKSKLQQVDVASGLKIDLNKEETKDESSAAALLLTFAPGFSLPSKDDMITIFGRFGSLNEKETEVLGDSYCARVAFMRSSDAEEAFNSSQKVSPFGHAVVNYGLHYSSPISGVSVLDGSSHLHPTPLPIEGNEPSACPSALRPPAAGEAPPLVFIKQNLEMMTSMLEQSGDKLSPEVKSNLEGEIKCLLNKLSTMDDSSLS
ncbi:uncharacterized protein LOC122079345 [Macadamia integrifolia]|uniref:uncharacterized protein LOC122079345 n=1 Tax=Macadamia integrifolia TaxID=60698 RepID=UPI001C4E876D|nr:uncharacterized protein LOC122079345 [Macadamia integrifolia]